MLSQKAKSCSKMMVVSQNDSDTSGPDNVIDLMEALKKSLDMSKKDSPEPENKRGTA